MKEKLLKAIGVAALLLMAGIIGLHYWFTTSWRNIVMERDMQQFTVHIKEAKPLPDNLVLIYETIYANASTTNYTEELINNVERGFFSKDWSDNGECYCDNILNEERFLIPPREGYINKDFDHYRLSFGLEENVGDEQCFNYYIRKEYEAVRHSQKNYPYSFIAKNIEELTREERVEFLIIAKAPRWYNKFHYPERFAARKKVIERKLEEEGI